MRGLRLNKKVDKIVSVAASGIVKLRGGNSGQHDEAMQTVLTTIRERSLSASGAKKFPTVAAAEGGRQLREQIGEGAIAMLTNGSIGKSVKAGLVSKEALGKHVSSPAAFSKAIGCSERYVETANARYSRMALPKALTLDYTSHRKCSETTKSREILERIVLTFFNSKTHVRSGAKSSTRELSMRKHELEIEWKSGFPLYAHEAKGLWPSWFSQLKEKKQLTDFESSVVASCDIVISDDFLADRFAFFSKEYKKKLLTNRARSAEISLCNSDINMMLEQGQARIAAELETQNDEWKAVLELKTDSLDSC